jgi:hypothetical protein
MPSMLLAVHHIDGSSAFVNPLSVSVSLRTSSGKKESWLQEVTGRCYMSHFIYVGLLSFTASASFT